ncbi:hypothetical protein J7L01_08230 [bacterium]|nr:hypothetical protein [bacterium]
MLRKMGVFLFLVVSLSITAMGSECVFQQPLQLYAGGGILGQITMSQYRDGDNVPYELHLDAVYHPWFLSAGIEFMTIPFHPDAQYAVDDVKYNLDWYGKKRLILGKVGVVFPQKSSEIGFFAHGGQGSIIVDWGQNGTTPVWENDTLNQLNAFTFGFSSLVRANIGVFNKCTPINLWMEVGWYRTLFGDGDLLSITNSSPTEQPFAKEARTLFTLAVGLEVDFFVACPSPPAWSEKR